MHSRTRLYGHGIDDLDEAGPVLEQLGDALRGSEAWEDRLLLAELECLVARDRDTEQATKHYLAAAMADCIAAWARGAGRRAVLVSVPLHPRKRGSAASTRRRSWRSGSPLASVCGSCPVPCGGCGRHCRRAMSA